MKTGKIKQKQADKEQKVFKDTKIKEHRKEVSKMRNNIKTFIKNFRSDVDKKKKKYQSYADKVTKKKA